MVDNDERAGILKQKHDKSTIWQIWDLSHSKSNSFAKSTHIFIAKTTWKKNLV